MGHPTGGLKASERAPSSPAMSLGRTGLRQSGPRVTKSSKAQVGRTSYEKLSGRLAGTPRADLVGRM